MMSQFESGVPCLNSSRVNLFWCRGDVVKWNWCNKASCVCFLCLGVPKAIRKDDFDALLGNSTWKATGDREGGELWMKSFSVVVVQTEQFPRTFWFVAGQVPAGCNNGYLHIKQMSPLNNRMYTFSFGLWGVCPDYMTWCFLCQGNQLRLRGEGDKGPKKGPNGDLYIQVKVEHRGSIEIYTWEK